MIISINEVKREQNEIREKQKDIMTYLTLLLKIQKGEVMTAEDHIEAILQDQAASDWLREKAEQLKELNDRAYKAISCNTIESI